ncbi:hypothetical protein ATN89_17320 [Comamonas thiooxydans]|uniref:hypothetical protein n=1 Tax=Comamonas thiooxydans TaxID=363952 RepID=UPI0007C44C41|nr:hypothetical protein [Comamonas thiooxydans]OAD82844.1 hypothetical protein ATN89_17320 [Comamonas thiooxydans]
MRVLNDLGEALRSQFVEEYGSSGNCSCHISPPCNSCCHPGNPLNLAEDDDCWKEEFDLDELVANAKKAIALTIEESAYRHLQQMRAIKRATNHILARQNFKRHCSMK